MSKALDIALALNILADIYFRFKEKGVEVTPDTLRDHIEKLEAKAALNNETLGITEAED